MTPETLLSGIREMISAGVRLQVATDPEEKRIAGELYTVNEGVVLEGLTSLHGFQQEVAKNLLDHETRLQSLNSKVNHHSHTEWRA
jgi:gamma-glutamylcyclotransferase (GGCT)/AIG2-like uncharacterized protein YtfP